MLIDQENGIILHQAALEAIKDNTLQSYNYIFDQLKMIQLDSDEISPSFVLRLHILAINLCKNALADEMKYFRRGKAANSNRSV